MFPPSFAREALLRHTQPGDVVLDPFSGRGTTLLEALLNDRRALALDINPVAYCISAAKANTPTLELVLDHVDRLENGYDRSGVGKLELDRLALPAFFRMAFSAETLRQLLFLRSRLRWKADPIDRFTAALTLGHLHGESGRSENYFSNQMPHSISTKPRYSLAYWRAHGLKPPHRDVFDILRDRAEFRLEEERPGRGGLAILSDVRAAASKFRNYTGRIAAVVTSPPYLDTTRFEEDQWLRLWFLGGPPRPTYGKVSSDDRHEIHERYWSFLEASWNALRPLLIHGATIVCRLGARGLAPEVLRAGLTASLRQVWPTGRLICTPVTTRLRNSQASLLHPDSSGCRYELDFTFRTARKSR